MSISATMVKELREKTNAGMMDCKKALTESNGDFDKAVDWLRLPPKVSVLRQKKRAGSRLKAPSSRAPTAKSASRAK